jgi:hypothetical protein
MGKTTALENECNSYGYKQINIRALPSWKDRAERCAYYQALMDRRGVSLTSFIVEAVEKHCETIEKRWSQNGN